MPFTAGRKPKNHDQLKFNVDKKPQIGQTFRVIATEKPENQYATKANEYAGKVATVKAYWGSLGIWVSVPGAEGLMEIPYDQCDWNWA